MKQYYITFAISLLCVPALFAHSDKSKTSVVSCGAETVECTAVVNAVGDPVELDVSEYTVVDLGTITEDKEVTVQLPAEAGEQTVYSFSPSTGESKDEKIYVVFDNIKQRPGTRLFGKTLIKAYRRFEGQKATSWIEVGKLTVHDKTLPTEMATVPLLVKTDGTAIWVNPATKQPTVFPIGKKDL